MPAASFSVIKNQHYAERIVWQSSEFLDTIEAAIRAVAFDVHTEDKATPRHEQRAQVAENIALSDVASGEARRFRNIFATIVLQNGTLEAQLFDRTSPQSTTITLESRVRPWLMDGLLLRQVIKSAWNVATGIAEEPVAS